MSQAFGSIGDWWYFNTGHNVEEFRILWDWADFWKAIEEKGVKAWLNHTWRYNYGGGCFPMPQPVSRLHDLIEIPIAAGIASIILWLIWPSVSIL